LGGYHMHFPVNGIRLREWRNPARLKSRAWYLDMLVLVSVVGAETHLGVPGVLCTRGSVYGRGPGWLHEL
jgi:hypothetical protein